MIVIKLDKLDKKPAVQMTNIIKDILQPAVKKTL